MIDTHVKIYRCPRNTWLARHVRSGATATFTVRHGVQRRRHSDHESQLLLQTVLSAVHVADWLCTKHPDHIPAKA